MKFPNEAIKGARFCAPRNVSTITYAGCFLAECYYLCRSSLVRFRRLGGPKYARQYLSTNKNDFVPHDGLPVGFTNQGVMSTHPHPPLPRYQACRSTRHL